MGSVESDEREYDGGGDAPDNTQAIKDRAEEILGNCALPKHDDYELMREAIIDDADLLERVMRAAWLVKPGFIHRQTFKDVGDQANTANNIGRRLEELAKEIAERELN